MFCEALVESREHRPAHPAAPEFAKPHGHRPAHPGPGSPAAQRTQPMLPALNIICCNSPDACAYRESIPTTRLTEHPGMHPSDVAQA